MSHLLRALTRLFNTAGCRPHRELKSLQLLKAPTTQVLLRHVADMAQIKNVTIDELLSERGKTLIIDVREVSEINETGVIPGGINIPLGTLPEVIKSPNFKDKFGVDPPQVDTKVILSCRSGKRSMQAAEALIKLGYTNIYNYPGGWLGYEKHRDGK